MDTTEHRAQGAAPGDERAGALAGLLSLQEHQHLNQRFFPSLESERWYLRQHRQELVDAGAVLYIGGRLWIDAKKFEAHMVAAGHEAAKRRGA